jgi:molybdopterin biosynthesis enzyme
MRANVSRTRRLTIEIFKGQASTVGKQHPTLSGKLARPIQSVIEALSFLRAKYHSEDDTTEAHPMQRNAAYQWTRSGLSVRHFQWGGVGTCSEQR